MIRQNNMTYFHSLCSTSSFVYNILILFFYLGPTPGRLQELVAETDAQTSALAEKIKNTLMAAKVNLYFTLEKHYNNYFF